MKDEKAVKIFKALASPIRLSMVRRLAACKDSRGACSELSSRIDLSQPTLSHHFNRLIESGIIIESKQRTSKFYSLNRKLLATHGIDINKL